MQRGGSYSLSIGTDVDLSGYAQVTLTIEDERGNQLQISGEDLIVLPDAVETILTDTQTMTLQSGLLKFQLRARNTATDALVSNIMEEYLYSVLKEGDLDGREFS